LHDIVIYMRKTSPDDTLLIRFVRQQTSGYREPERKGTPKGEVIGFSLRKYKSILFSLTLLDIQEIAKLAGVSYGLLRVWRTESEYQKERQRLIRDFSLLFSNNLVEFAFKQFKKGGAIHSKSPTKIDRIDNLSIALFSDIVIYSEDVLEQIIEVVKQIDLKQYSFLGGIEMGVFLNALATVWGIRKGLVIITKDRKHEFTQDALSDSEKIDLVKVFKVADALQKPWTASKEAVDEAMTSFVKRLKM